MGLANRCNFFRVIEAAGGGREGALKGLGAGVELVNDFLGKAGRRKEAHSEHGGGGGGAAEDGWRMAEEE